MVINGLSYYISICLWHRYKSPIKNSANILCNSEYFIFHNDSRELCGSATRRHGWLTNCVWYESTVAHNNLYLSLNINFAVQWFCLMAALVHVGWINGPSNLQRQQGKVKVCFRDGVHGKKFSEHFSLQNFS